MFSPANTSTAQTAKVPALPLKLVIQAKYIGAIIGHGGNTIREIAKSSQARCMVDVHSPIHDEKGNQENIVLITGTADSCSKACSKMLQVIHGEVERERGHETAVELKIRVFNQLIGRLIGKGGSTVKSIMEETGATVTINDPRNADYNYYPIISVESPMMDRTVIIRGNSLSIVSNAERKISEKLHSFYETDSNKRTYSKAGHSGKMTSMVPMPPPLIFVNSPTSMYDGCSNGYDLSSPPLANGAAPNCVMFSQQPFGGGAPISSKMSVMPMPIYLKSRIYVPSSFIGSLIGSKGTYIRTMMQFTGATINIESNDKKHRKSDKKHEKAKDDSSEDRTEKHNNNEPEAEHKSGSDSAATQDSVSGTDDKEKRQYLNNAECTSVMITGLDYQVLKAEFWIYQRIAESSIKYMEEIVLMSEVFVPSKIVGRIIGRNGQNVRELQRITRAIVKVPEEIQSSSGGNNVTAAGDGSSPKPLNGCHSNSETAVIVTGSYYSLQAVQCRFGVLITETEQREQNDTKRSRFFAKSVYAASHQNHYQPQPDYHHDDIASPSATEPVTQSTHTESSTPETDCTTPENSPQAGGSDHPTKSNN